MKGSDRMTRSLVALEGNRQRLDGGAMYGNVPRALWSTWSPPDEQGRIDLACRAMLVEDSGRRLLFDTGIGAFLAPRLRDRYGVLEDGHVLLESLAALGLTHADIDVVVLSHLHFDHAGGLLTPWAEGEPPHLLFDRATYVTSRRAFDRARRPHRRDRASFIPELPDLLEQSGRLVRVDEETCPVLGDGFCFHTSDGHTPGLLLTEVAMDDGEGPVLFGADLVPGLPWLHLPVTMGYDRFPERLVDEKEEILGSLHECGGRIFFTHDPDVALARLHNERGRFVGEPLGEV